MQLTVDHDVDIAKMELEELPAVATEDATYSAVTVMVVAEEEGQMWSTMEWIAWKL